MSGATLHDHLSGYLLRIRPAPLAVILKRLLRVRRRLIDTAEGQFWVDPATFIGHALIEKGIFVPELVAVLKHLLRPGGVFVDVGAQEGYFTVIGARIVGQAGRALAIEPQMRLRPIIERNLALNALRNVAVEPSAISDKAGTVTFQLSPETNTGSSGFTNLARYNVPTTIVATKTLTQVLEEHGIDRVDCLKVDIEGAEYEAILGSRELFENHRVSSIALELHPTRLAALGHSGKDVEDLFSAAGYVRLATTQETVWVLPTEV